MIVNEPTFFETLEPFRVGYRALMLWVLQQLKRSLQTLTHILQRIADAY